MQKCSQSQFQLSGGGLKLPIEAPSIVDSREQIIKGPRVASRRVKQNSGGERIFEHPIIVQMGTWEGQRRLAFLFSVSIHGWFHFVSQGEW